MSVKRVFPDEAKQLLEAGWTYLDVRSVPEFEQGHPEGAYNIPLLLRASQGMVPNGEFLHVGEATFTKDTKLVVGCRSGKRSLRAAELLIEGGFTKIVEMRGGFAGEFDSAGRVTCEGWQVLCYPIATAAEHGRRYQELWLNLDQMGNG